MALTDSLISYWPLNEASGNALDAHGSNTLTDNNTVASATGKIGNARDFERNNSEFFSLADNASLSNGDIDFSISAWVWFESKPAGNASIVAKDVSSPGGEFYLYYNPAVDRFQLDVFGSTGFGGAGSVVANNFGSPSISTWYLVQVWHDSVNNQLGIAVNAGTPNTASHSAGVFDGPGAWRIGADSFGDYFDGLIDEVGFWKRVLTSGERTQLYNGGNGLAYPFSTQAPRSMNQFRMRRAS